MNRLKIKNIALSAIFTSIIAATAWISFPTPFGVNLACTLFGVCLTAFCLNKKSAILAVVAYIALGAIGVPVFSQFMGGFGILFGASGGFLWGFIAVTVICSLSKNVCRKTVKYSLMILSVFICHAAGVIQYSVVSGNGLWISFISVSLPFLLKDIGLAFLAYFIAKKIKIT